MIAIGEYDLGIQILEKSLISYVDYQTYVFIGDGYFKSKKIKKAIESYEYAENMVPNRFVPLYKQFLVFKENKDIERLKTISKKINQKPVKINSSTVEMIKQEVNDYLFIINQASLEK